MQLRVALCALLCCVLLWSSSVEAAKKKDWSKVRDDDLDKVLNAYEDDDPDNPLTKGPDGVPMPKSSQKTEMGFVTLRKELAKSKKETEEIRCGVSR